MKKILYALLIFLLIFVVAGCNSNSSTDSSSSNTTTNNTVVGDWKFQESSPENVKLDLDLESNNEFNLDYEATSNNTQVESEFEGTYEATDKTITLSIIQIEQVAPNHSGQVVENGQITLNYKLSDDGKQLTISNSDSSVDFLPKELTGTRETD